MKSILALFVALSAMVAQAAEGDFLVKMRSNGFAAKNRLLSYAPANSKVEDLGGLGWFRVQVPKKALKSFNQKALSQLPGVVMVQPNYKIRLVENPSVVKARQEMSGIMDWACKLVGGLPAAVDNPEIPVVTKTNASGSDPLFANQWGMMDIGVREAWKLNKGAADVVVAVIDTGVDYTHEDLVENLWRNPGETGIDANGRDKATNGIDDDGNGYIDDVIGWDFVSDDNKPFDLNVGCVELLQGGNPGHGTHCAGNIAARGFNGKGIAGVAPNVSIMSLRFLSESGQGTTDGAVKAILYAINNGARVLSNSWGSEGEDPSEPNHALKDAISLAEARGILFVAAAGNGRSDGMNPAQGYDNDTDAKPAYPASYPHDIIVSVAAIDAQDELGSFSNFGRNSVDVGAPGVNVYSTVVGGGYSNVVLDLSIIGMPKITWDGTSMATPHVAGAAALYWSQYPNASWQQVKDAIIRSAVPVPALQGKTFSGGKLNVREMLNF